MKRQFGALLALLLIGFTHPAEAVQRLHSGPEDREGVHLTVYNGNFGLVREVRDLGLVRGPLELEFGGVASTIQPETVSIRSLTRPDALRVLEQNYQYDLLSPQKLLEKYVGKQVKVYRWNEKLGRDEEHEAEVLAVNGGTILRIGNEITFNFPGRIAFPEIPENLIAKPSLVWLLESERERQRIEASYLANQLNWKADYVLVVNDDDTKGGLTGWVTLTNQSGASYRDANLQLVAGDVHRAVDAGVFPAAAGRLASVAREEAGFSEESFFEYHLYTLERPATLLENEQKQITLLEAPKVGVDKRLIFHGAPYYYRGNHGQVMSNQKVGVYLDLENRKGNGMGMPLPKGIVRVYKEDSRGGRQFIGEDRIDHTPRDERIRMKIGEAFDVVGDRKQMEYRVTGHCESESSWEIELRNHKDEDVTVEIFEPVGGDWRILESSHEWKKEDAHTFTFQPTVEANGKEKIRYRVRTRWCW